MTNPPLLSWSEWINRAPEGFYIVVPILLLTAFAAGAWLA
jgi:hypothetical protein